MISIMLRRLLPKPLKRFGRAVIDGVNGLRIETRRQFSYGLISLFGKMAGGHPLPLAFWRTLRGAMLIFGPGPERLVARSRHVAGDRSTIRPLEGILTASDTLGHWTLGEETLDFLWKQLEALQPTAIVEFGAGLSTLLLATYAARSAAAGREVVLVSIEQSQEEKNSLEKRLQAHGLSSNILVYPVSSDGYATVTEDIEKIMGRKKFDMVIVDGPAGPDGCRTSTLLAIQSFCNPGARWYLDDAYRDSEQSSLRRWEQVPEIKIDGIIPLGHGLATGIIRPLNSR